MKKVLFPSIVMLLFYASCSKSSNSPGDTNPDPDKQITNRKWYYDSTIFWNNSTGFHNENWYDIKSFVWFGTDSIMTDNEWNGLSYDVTSYPYVIEGEKIKCAFFTGDEYGVLKNNQLVIGDSKTSPRETNTDGHIEMIWWYYHK